MYQAFKLLCTCCIAIGIFNSKIKLNKNERIKIKN